MEKTARSVSATPPLGSQHSNGPTWARLAQSILVDVVDLNINVKMPRFKFNTLLSIHLSIWDYDLAFKLAAISFQVVWFVEFVQLSHCYATTDSFQNYCSTAFLHLFGSPLETGITFSKLEGHLAKQSYSSAQHRSSLAHASKRNSSPIQRVTEMTKILHNCFGSFLVTDLDILNTLGAYAKISWMVQHNTMVHLLNSSLMSQNEIPFSYKMPMPPKCIVPFALCKPWQSKCLDVVSLPQRAIKMSLMSSSQSLPCPASTVITELIFLPLANRMQLCMILKKMILI